MCHYMNVLLVTKLKKLVLREVSSKISLTVEKGQRLVRMHLHLVDGGPNPRNIEDALSLENVKIR